MSISEPHNTPLGIKSSISHFRNMKNPFFIFIHQSLFIITSIILFCVELYLDWKTELNGHGNEIGEVKRLMTHAMVIWAFLSLTTPLLALNPLLFISETSKTHISFISIKVFSLLPQLFHFILFCSNLFHF